MRNPLPDHDGAELARAALRVTLVVVILVSEQLVDARQLAGSGFFVVLGIAAVYALVSTAVALRPAWSPNARALLRWQPGIDVLLLVGLAYTSGAAYSDARKAFFVIPLAAAFSERPRSTAKWSFLAVALFTLQAVVAGGHLKGAVNSWQRLTLNQDLYLAWTGAAATLLAFALRRRSAQIEQLAGTRQRLVIQAMESVERERTRLANALHDSPVQNLIAARHDLRRAERSRDPESFARLHEALDVTIAELRKEIFDLRPPVLDHVGLKAALEQMARRQTADSGVPVTVHFDCPERVPHQEALFALGRELLGNAAKHAQADDIHLRLSQDASGVLLEVADDGSGIPPDRMREALLEGHIGLAAARERAATLNGTLSITTALGAGTRVTVTLPYTQDMTDARPAGADVSDRVAWRDTPLASSAQA